MKFLLTLLTACLLFTAPARAADVTLAWDDDQTGVTYRIEMADSAAPDVWTIQAEGIIPKEYTALALPPGRYLFRCFAVAGDLSSDPSTILEVIVRPNAPGKLRIKVALKVSRDGLKTWQTVAEYEEDAEATAFFRAEIAAVR